MKPFDLEIGVAIYFDLKQVPETLVHILTAKGAVICPKFGGDEGTSSAHRKFIRVIPSTTWWCLPPQ
jgi:hypothetical protein